MKKEGYILIVEDSHTQARQIESILKQLGYGLTVAFNGKEALEEIRREKPLLVVCDILMPEMDGYELCRTIKSDDSLKDIILILLTQLSEPREIIRGLECGADDFIVKPYNEELLLTRIQTVLSYRTRNSAEPKAVRILVVEDSPTQAEQLKFLLEQYGYSVSTAGNGREGLAIAREIKPTVVISDILMPEMDGYELAIELKRDEALKKTPIILITSLMDRKELVAKAAVVADGFFTKPYDDSYLIGKIETILAERKIRETGSETLEVSFAGEKYSIGANKRQILSFLLSTYESAVQQNRDLILMQRELQIMNEQLEERAAEKTEQLKASETNFGMLLEMNADPIIVVGADNRINLANRAAGLMFGLGPEEITGKAFGFETAPGTAKDVEIPSETGGSVTAEMRAAEIKWDGKKAYLATLRDVTERKKIEKALRESEESFRALAENANDGILIAVEKGRNIYANKRLSDMTGYGMEELLKMSIADLAHPDARAILSERFKNRLAGGSEPRQYETVFMGKDKKSIPIEVTASRSSWKGENAVIGIIRDISERKKREEELIRNDKLESLGTLAGGIAHDFNNLLTGVVGNVSLAKVLVKPEEKVYKILNDVERASLLAKDLTKQLLTFAKGGSPVKRPLIIGDLLQSSTNFPLRGSNVKCSFSIPEGLWAVEADGGQMSQVIHNLIINAQQSMPDGGLIELTAENAVVGADSFLPVADGKYVKITVKDAGVGIPAKNLVKIFDPYFTTKENGSGLGLATVYSIIKSHNGYITVESEEGRGSVFQIFLPASLTQSVHLNEPVETTHRGKGKILIMDDEEIVRDVCGQLLGELGYEVSFARDGSEAIEKYKKEMGSGNPFSAVIMDLTIPGGMGGREAIKKLIEVDPAVKAIVSSGYSDDAIMSEYGKHGFRAVIAKPYKIAEISKIVYKVINES